MIGGHDIVIKTCRRPGPAALDLIVRFMQRRWREAIIQDGTTGTRFTSYRQVPFGRLREVLVYQDESAFGAWATVGRDPSTASAMVHLIVDGTGFTLVVGDPDDSVMVSIVNEAREALAPTGLWAMDVAK